MAYVAYESNRQRKEWPRGSQMMIMAADPQNIVGLAAARAVFRVACGGDEGARRSYLHQLSIWYQEKTLTSLENTSCVLGTDRAKINAPQGKSRFF